MYKDGTNIYDEHMIQKHKRSISIKLNEKSHLKKKKLKAQLCGVKL